MRQQADKKESRGGFVVWLIALDVDEQLQARAVGSCWCCDACDAGRVRYD